LINGDDVVFKGNELMYNMWCEFCSKIGLRVSTTKSYCSKTNFTLNSRTFRINNDGVPVNDLFTRIAAVMPKANFGYISITTCGIVRYIPPKNRDETLFEISSRLNEFFSFERPEESWRVFAKVNGMVGKRKHFPITVHPSRGGLGLRVPDRMKGPTFLSLPCYLETTRVQRDLVRAVSNHRRFLRDPLAEFYSPDVCLSFTERVADTLWNGREEDSGIATRRRILDVTYPYRSVSVDTWNAEVHRTGNLNKKIFDQFYIGLRRQRALSKKTPSVLAHCLPFDDLVDDKVLYIPKFVFPLGGIEKIKKFKNRSGLTIYRDIKIS
jgi:hypothetical protein